MTNTPILSHYQASALLEAHRAGHTTTVTSLDLGLTSTEVSLTPDRLILPDAVLAWNEIEEIAQHDTACFVVEDNRSEQIRGFSESHRARVRPDAHRVCADDVDLRPAHASHQGHQSAPGYARQDQSHRADPRPRAGHVHRTGLYRHRSGENRRARDHDRVGSHRARDGALQSLVPIALRQPQDRANRRRCL